MELFPSAPDPSGQAGARGADRPGSAGDMGSPRGQSLSPRGLGAAGSGAGGVAATSLDTRADGGGLSPAERDGGAPGAIAADAGGPVAARRCTGPFGEPEPLGGLGLSTAVYGPAPTADGLTLFLSSIDGSEDIFFARRSTLGGPFDAAQRVSGVNEPTSDEGTPFPSADGLSLFFFSTRLDAGGTGDRNLWAATGSASLAAFEAPFVIPGVNGDGLDHMPRLTADALALLFVSGRPSQSGASNIWISERASLAQPFGAPAELPGVNTDAREEGFWLAADGLSLYFSSNREGAVSMDLWVSVRPDAQSAFEAAENLSALNTPSDDLDPALTADGAELFFASDRSGTMQLYRSLRACP